MRAPRRGDGRRGIIGDGLSRERSAADGAADFTIFTIFTIITVIFIIAHTNVSIAGLPVPRAPCDGCTEGSCPVGRVRC